VRHYQPRQASGIAAGIYVVLVIDQFEEFLTQASQEERQSFVDLLFTAATKRDVPLLIIVTCRIDFYQELMTYNNFFDLMRQHEVIVKPMTQSEIRDAIELPLQKLGGEFSFEAGLVDRILTDLQGQREALPILQFALFELFERRQGCVLTQQTYAEIHGIQGILSAHAEKTYASFAKQQAQVQSLFLRLVKVSMDENQELVTARQCIDYEQCLPAKAAERTELDKIINAFVGARLLTIDRQGKRSTLEISHEVLLRIWPRLAEWVHDNKEALHTKNRATQDALTWQRLEQPKRELYTSTQLQRLKKLHKQGLISGEEPLHSFFLHSRRREQRTRVIQICMALLILLIVGTVGYNILPLLRNSMSDQVTVTTANDKGAGSLQQALQDAKPGETIVLDQQRIGSAITLQSDLNFTTNVMIEGNNVALSGPSGQQIHIFPGVNVTFHQLTVKNSKPAKDSSVARGGVIFNQGELTLRGCTISNNQSNYDGGALVNAQGNLVLDGTTFSNNLSAGYGGAIYNLQGSVAVINGSHIDSNRAYVWGGGLYSRYGQVTITNSFVDNNKAGRQDGSRYYGGGLSLLDAPSAVLNASTITGNTSVIDNNSTTTPQGGGGVAVEMSAADQHPVPQALITNMPITNQSDQRHYIGKNSIQQQGKDKANSTSQYQDVLSSPIASFPAPSAIYLKAMTTSNIGYPPPTDTTPEMLQNNYLGTLDIDDFCQTQGYSHGEPTPSDISAITCVSPFESNTSYSYKDFAEKACNAQYPGLDNLTARLSDYYDPSSWECFKDIEKIEIVKNQPFSLTAGDNLDRFCRDSLHSTGLQKNVQRKTAFEWQCQNADGNLIGISVTDACRYLTGDQNAFDRLASFSDPNGWECWRPKQKS
jgi:hypothetical protein